MLAITANIKTKMVYKEKEKKKLFKSLIIFIGYLNTAAKKIAQNNENSRKQAVSLHS